MKRDLTQKYGAPDREEQVQYQNGFGAVFLHPRTIWERRADVTIRAEEEQESRLPDQDVLGALKMYCAHGTCVLSTVDPVTVDIADWTWAQSLAAEEKNRPSSIDWASPLARLRASIRPLNTDSATTSSP